MPRLTVNSTNRTLIAKSHRMRCLSCFHPLTINAMQWKGSYRVIKFNEIGVDYLVNVRNIAVPFKCVKEILQKGSRTLESNQNLSALYRGRWTESKRLCYIPLLNNPISKYNNQNLSTEQKQQIYIISPQNIRMSFSTWQQSDKRNTHTWQTLPPAFPFKEISWWVSRVELSNSPYSHEISVKKANKTLCGL